MPARPVSPAQRLRRRLRLKFPWKRDALVSQVLLEKWEAAGILAPQPASHVDIRRFEQEYGVVLPDDMRDYFLTVNGTKVGELGRDDEYQIGFWHLSQVRTVVEAGISDDPDDRSTFAFAEYLMRFGVYGVRLSADAAAPTPVVVRFPYGQFQVAATFGEFLIRYVLGDTSVLFPDFLVVADDTGIGAEADGVTSYVVLWSDVREIAAEVVVPKDVGAEPVLVWVIAGSYDARPFIAPVDTVAGGNVLRAKVRGLDGFDESAFEAARGAEERGEAGRFVVWRAEREYRTMS